MNEPPDTDTVVSVEMRLAEAHALIGFWTALGHAGTWIGSPMLTPTVSYGLLAIMDGIGRALGLDERLDTNAAMRAHLDQLTAELRRLNIDL